MLEQRLIMDTQQRMEMAHMQLTQFSQNQTKPRKNRFAKLHTQRFVNEGIARIMRLKATDVEIDNAVQEFLMRMEAVMPFDDFFFDEHLHSALFAREAMDPPAIYCNSCSVGLTSEGVRKAMDLALSQERLAIDHGEHELACKETSTMSRLLREKIASMLRTDARSIALTRNAGEAAALTAAMAGLFTRNKPLEKPVAFGDDTHLSTLLNMLLVGDAGNAEGRDPLSAVPISFATRGKQYQDADVQRWLGQNSFLTFAVRGKTLKQIENEVKRRFKDYKPETVVVTHVDRATGVINRLHEIGGILAEHCDQPTVIVDGAMAFGNIDIDLDKLFEGSSYSKHISAIDAYIGTTGKAIGGPSVGFSAFKPASTFQSRGIERLKTAGSDLLILHGMFDQLHGINPTVQECLSKGDLFGALRAIEELENHPDGIGITGLRGGGSVRDMSVKRLAEKRRESRRYLKEQLIAAFDDSMKIEFLEAKKGSDQSPLILTFRLPRVDMRSLVERLQSKQHVFATYIDAYDAIRIGIDRDLGWSREGYAKACADPLPEGEVFISDLIERMKAEIDAMELEGLVLEQTKKK